MKGIKKHLAGIITAGVACVITILVLAFELSNYGTDKIAVIHALCDGFFVAAVCVLSMGVLAWAAGQGSFYGLQYLFHCVVSFFSPRKDRFEKRKSYYEFLNEAKSKEKTDVRSILLVGVLWLLAAIVMLVIFEMNVSQ
ncbi:MAG: DUF3899 domain-containing protein [Agathobacter sp.]